MYISVTELVKRIEVLPAAAQGAFAPLKLPGVPTKSAPASAAKVESSAPEPMSARRSDPAADVIAPKRVEPSVPDVSAPEPKAETKPEEQKPLPPIAAALPAIATPRPRTPSAVPLVPTPVRDKPTTVPPPGELREPAPLTKPAAMIVDTDKPRE